MLPQSAVPRAQTKIKKTKKQKKKPAGDFCHFLRASSLFLRATVFFSLQNLSIYEILFQQLASLI